MKYDFVKELYKISKPVYVTSEKHLEIVKGSFLLPHHRKDKDVNEIAEQVLCDILYRRK